MRPVVLLDCDGVLCDYVGPYLKAVNYCTGKSYQREDVDQWNIPEALNLSETDVDWVETQVVRQEGWCRNLPVLDGAQAGVEELRKLADVFVVTAGMGLSPYWLFERQQWLETHFGIDEKHLIFAAGASKRLVKGHFFVDDNHRNVTEWFKANWHHAILWDAPHNKKDEWPHRTSSWDDLVAAVEKGFWP